MIVKDGLSENQQIAALLKKFHRIVGHFKHSNKAFGRLKEIQQFLEIPVHSLLQEVTVRWNSAFMMAQRLVEKKEAINRYALEEGDLSLTLLGKEWDILEELVQG